MSPAPMFKKWRVGPVDDGPTRKPGPHSQPPMRQNTPVQRLNTKRDAIHDESLFRDPEEPVYLLSLDGGGVRGISEAVILHELMLRIQKKLNLPELPRPCEYFDLIGGTSTGGLIAIMLGRLRMSTREVLHEYKTIAKKIFRIWNRRPDLSFGKKKLEQCVKSTTAAHVEQDDMGMMSKTGVDKGLCFVVSLRKAKDGDVNTPTLFRSYKRTGSNGTRDEGTGDSPDCEIWEAARATTAAPRYFAPAQITVDGKVQYFVDGALKWNNPASLVLEEAESHFGRHRTLGCLVSLGTGLRPSPLKEKGRGGLGKSWSISEMVGLASTLITEPEGVHNTIRDRLKGHMDSYFRFTVPHVSGQARIKIHQYKRMMSLCQATEEYLKEKETSDQLDKLVDVLINKEATGLTLQAACRANSAETSMAQITYKLQHRKTTSPVFTGRKEVLKLLDDWSRPRLNGPYPRRDFWLWGVGGIGKTQIALHFVDLYRDRFDRVWWIDAAMPYNSYETIASQVLEHPPKGKQLIPAVLDWLESSKEEWLLVVDGYDDNSKGDLSTVLPGLGRGNILFTSTRFDIRPESVNCVSYQVPVMSISESITLLLRAAGLDHESEDLRARAEPVVEELGSFPLALNQAGAFINRQHCPLEKYVAVFRQNKRDLLRDPKHKGKSAGELAVYTTFDLSLKRLRLYAAGSTDDSEKAMAYKSALELLHAFCFYHWQNIPLEILARTSVNVGIAERWDEIQELMSLTDDESVQSNESAGRESTETREAIEDIVLGICPRTRSVDIDYILSGTFLLMQFSLLKYKAAEEATCEMHPLVHSWLRDRMDPDSYRTNFRLARAILFYSFFPKYNDVDSERFYRALLPHMEMNNSFMPKDDSSRALSIEEVVDQNAIYTMILKRSHRWEEMIPPIQQSILYLSHEFGLNATRTISSLLELGKVYMAAGRIDDAVSEYNKVLERASSWDDRNPVMEYVLDAESEFAMVHLLRGEHVSAQILARHALDMAEECGVEPQAHRARLCLVYQYQSMWEEAGELAELVLELRMSLRQRGPEHHKTLKTVAELARIRAQQGRTYEAIRDLTDVTVKLEKMLGPHDRNAVAAKSDLAWVYYLQGGDRLEKAEELQKEALRRGRLELGDRHPYTLLMIMRLGLTVGERGRFNEANGLLDECKRGRSAVLGPKHVATVGAGAAMALFTCKRKGKEWMESKGYTQEDVEWFEDMKRRAEFPYMYVRSLG